MKHHYTDTDKPKSFPMSWSISDSGFGMVVLRLHDGSDEAIVKLTPKQARSIADELLHCAARVEIRAESSFSSSEDIPPQAG
ncbi:MAG: hypothetical protein K8H84_10115 [Sulfuricella denitrificans]|nr:hypothetical protein [Sulfuricella denitrificans]